MKYVVFTENEETLEAASKIPNVVVASPIKREGLKTHDPARVLKMLENVKERGTYEITYDGILSKDDIKRLRSLGYTVRAFEDFEVPEEEETNTQESEEKTRQDHESAITEKERELEELKKKHEEEKTALIEGHKKEIDGLKEELKNILNA